MPSFCLQQAPSTRQWRDAWHLHLMQVKGSVRDRLSLALLASLQNYGGVVGKIYRKRGKIVSKTKKNDVKNT